MTRDGGRPLRRARGRDPRSQGPARVRGQRHSPDHEDNRPSSRSVFAFNKANRTTSRSNHVIDIVHPAVTVLKNFRATPADLVRVQLLRDITMCHRKGELLSGRRQADADKKARSQPDLSHFSSENITAAKPVGLGVGRTVPAGSLCPAPGWAFPIKKSKLSGADNYARTRGQAH